MSSPAAQIPDPAGRPIWAILGLWTVAVAQPLFELLGNRPAFLLYHRVGPLGLVLFTIVLAAGGPALLILAQSLAGRLAPTLATGLHRVLIGLLTAALVLQLLRREPLLPAALSLAIAALTTAVLLGIYARWRGPRMFCAVLAVGAPLAAALFLIGPAARTVLAPAAAAQTGPAPPAGAAAWTTPVVVVVFDELSLLSLLDADQRIDGRHYPSFAALAARATWFRQASTSHHLTTHALPMLLTGRRDVDPDHPTRERHPQNLFSVLEPSHRIHALEQVTRLAPESSASTPSSEDADRSAAGRLSTFLADLAILYAHLVVPAELALELPPIDRTWGNFRGNAAAGDTTSGLAAFARREGRVSQFRAFVEQIAPSSPPGLYFIHTLLPHLPWRLLPSGHVYGPSRLQLRHVQQRHRVSSDFPPLYDLARYQRYLLQVALADRLLGEMLARLEQQGMLDRSLIVVTADHGISNRPGQSQRYPHDTSHPQDILRVPLLVKAPFQRRGLIDDHPVLSFDVLPTIADLLGLELAGPIDGHSAFDPRRPTPEHQLLADREGTAHAYPTIWPADDGSLDYRLSSFDWDDPLWGLFRFGPYGALIGRPTRGPPRADGLRLELDDPAAFEDWDPAAPYAPARIAGALHGPGTPREGRHLAVAVNDTFAAVTQTVVLEGVETFAALVPLHALVPGHNRVDVFSIEGPPARFTLHWVRPR